MSKRTDAMDLLDKHVPAGIGKSHEELVGGA